MKLLIIGHGRHGKDTAAEILQDEFCIRSSSSSEAAHKAFIAEALEKEYDNERESYADRLNFRTLWFELICFYNRKDKTRLAREILKDHDCYVGMRSKEELMACKEAGLFDLIIWIDASERLPVEDSGSNTISESDADLIIQNNGTKEEFYKKIVKIGNQLFK